MSKTISELYPDAYKRFKDIQDLISRWPKKSQPNPQKAYNMRWDDGSSGSIMEAVSNTQYGSSDPDAVAPTSTKS